MRGGVPEAIGRSLAGLHLTVCQPLAMPFAVARGSVWRRLRVAGPGSAAIASNVVVLSGLLLIFGGATQGPYREQRTA